VIRLTGSNIVTVEEGAEREYVGPHLTTLAEQQIALNGVLAKLVCPNLVSACSRMNNCFVIRT
jgi:hypothetical protein